MGGGCSLGVRALFASISASPVGRGDLAERLGLLATTVTRTIRPLIEAGLIEEQPLVRAVGPGRPTCPLAVVPNSVTTVGIKLTNDRLYAVLTNSLGEVPISNSRPLTDADAGSVTALITSVVAQLTECNGRRPDAVGIPLGTAVIRRRTMVMASFLGWRDMSLAAMVPGATGLPYVATNDMHAFAYAETWFGAGHGRDPFAIVTLGAEVGCGVVAAGKIVSGAQGAVDNVGHLSIDPSGPNCEIGHPGCARVLVSIPGILRVTAERLEYEAGELNFDLLLSPNIRYHNGADDVPRHVALMIGRVVGTFVAYVDPELVVVSGGGVAVVETYREVFDEEVGGLRHQVAAPVPVLLRPFESDEWTRGATALALGQRAVVTGGR